jgi:hypothetical protein
MHDAELVLDDNHPGLRAVLRFKRAETVLRPAKAAQRAEPRVEQVH